MRECHLFQLRVEFVCGDRVTLRSKSLSQISGRGFEVIIRDRVMFKPTFGVRSSRNLHCHSFNLHLPAFTPGARAVILNDGDYSPLQSLVRPWRKLSVTEVLVYKAFEHMHTDMQVENVLHILLKPFHAKPVVCQCNRKIGDFLLPGTFPEHAMYECAQRLKFQTLRDTWLALLVTISSLSIPLLRFFRSDLSLLELATEVSSLK